MFLDKVKLNAIYLVLSENKCPQVTFMHRNDKGKAREYAIACEYFQILSCYNQNVQVFWRHFA